MLCSPACQPIPEMQRRKVFGGQARGDDHVAAGIEGDQAPIEQRVEVRCEGEAVEDVHPLLVARAVGPRLRVAGAQHVRQGQPGHGAGATPVVEQRLAKDVLSHGPESHDLGVGAGGDLVHDDGGGQATGSGRPHAGRLAGRPGV